MSTLNSAQGAVDTVANQAIYAALQQTFAVGGAIIDNGTGEVIVAMHNNVLMPFGNGTPYFLPHDPTAHGERQLVDWYYENAASLNLPPPNQLTIVTTLDPCAMCAGSLLTAGFNVAVSAIDDYAGINYNSQFSFPSLPPQIRQQAQATWGYYAVAEPVSRGYQGSSAPVFAGQAIDSAAYFLTGSIFSASVNTVRDASNNSGLPPDQLQNPARLPANSKVRRALTELSPYALSVQSANPRDPGAELAPPLLQAAQQGSVFNSVALLDPFGNLLLCLGGREDRSPIRTAFMETTRSYAVLRWTLMNDPDPAVRAEAEHYLTHPKYGTFVFLYAPDPNTPQAVMTFGAYGSTMEGPVPQSYPSNLQYVLLPGTATAQALGTLAQNLPPFYTQSVQVAPNQVLSQDLINEVKKGV
ncbi:nucleoside deaminase [Pseudomonas benzenivorans]|uniref:Nucleoside deaminase n=1 Tax=Pseudomonas benzenivorans TaxID=556533 RepID=A0ABZ0Q0H1_9PSED|nr:nucleoside deaminase [Pseudomonas benzenivorans]WPC06476.1 nucleoside deaminase [Pseudomonas benzenivorans]